jgi:hypothetical protein
MFVSSYGGKIFLQICKLEWFKSKQNMSRWKVFISSQEPYKAVNFDIAALFLCRRNFHWPHSGVFRVHYFIFWGRGDRGLWLCDIASLVKYFNEASLRIVTISLYRTAPPYSILNDCNISSCYTRTLPRDTGQPPSQYPFCHEVKFCPTCWGLGCNQPKMEFFLDFNLTNRLDSFAPCFSLVSIHE